MEEPMPKRSPRDQRGAAGAHSANEPCQSPVGCATDSWRVAKARPDGLASDGFEVHAPTSAAAVAGVANLLEQPRDGPDRTGFLYGPDSNLSSPFGAHHADAQPTPAGPFNFNGEPDAGRAGGQALRGRPAGERPSE